LLIKKRIYFWYPVSLFIPIFQKEGDRSSLSPNGFWAIVLREIFLNGQRYRLHLRMMVLGLALFLNSLSSFFCSSNAR